MKIFLLLLWLIPIAINIYLDRNRPVRNYLQVNTIRAMCSILHAIPLLPPSYEYTGATAGELFTMMLPIWAFQLSSYWVLFEAGLNLVWKEHLLYYDTKEGNSGWVDRFFKWTGPEVHFVAKILALITAIYSFKLCLEM